MTFPVQVLDTIAEIQARHDAVKDIEKKLLELHQVFPLLRFCSVKKWSFNSTCLEPLGVTIIPHDWQIFLDMATLVGRPRGAS